MRDADLWFPYDNDPEPTKYTALVQIKVWSYVDVEAMCEEDLKDSIRSLSRKELFEDISDYEIEQAEFENGEEIFDDSEENYLRCKIRKLEKEIEELKKESK